MFNHIKIGLANGLKIRAKRKQLEKYRPKSFKFPNMNTTHNFDIENEMYYEYNKPELRERTRQRLTEIAECGMSVVGYGQFGYEGIMSGLYIEMVWSYSDEKFKSYMDWAKQLINSKK